MIVVKLMVILTSQLGILQQGAAEDTGQDKTMATQQQQQRQDLSTDFSVLAGINNEFATDIYQLLSKDAPSNANIFISPFSILSAMAMTYAGSRNETKLQMDRVLRFGKYSGEDLHSSFQTLNSALFGKKDNCTLECANKLFARKGYNFLQDYLALTRSFYGAELEVKDFDAKPEEARLEINQWVEEQTAQKIKNLLPEGAINSLVAMVLVNAVYFKGNWASQFDPKQTQKAPFQLTSTNKIKVDMMYQESEFPLGYSTELECQILEIPYVGKNLSMLIYLPDKIDGLKDLESKMTSSLLETTARDLFPDTVMVKLPKFKLTEEYRLHEKLGQMGMPDLFTEGVADLSGMDGTRMLFLSQVHHKAFIDVNEEGTEAAAAATTVTNDFAMPRDITFVADHPFLFFIRDNISGAVLFMGRLQMPAGPSVKDEL
ncbi:leukocyte elastase inhibitor-like [Lingula anatina]|uniref:Leukocyte elastase inhibitor-like n=1 Tax=Lingula anatina TaxID=7574 RepID=A0A1S3J819_LINAN|nr:leukocyte elastase inhibitor-like [Lingula anatina]|eukprot:XP_013406458.1 leukocyte elastase inhibitor-like [Lingula anatina]